MIPGLQGTTAAPAPVLEQVGETLKQMMAKIGSVALKVLQEVRHGIATVITKICIRKNDRKSFFLAMLLVAICGGAIRTKK